MAQNNVEEIKPELDIDEQLSLHKTGWIVQRIGWGLIFLLPLLGALGMFGEGVLSSQNETKGAIKMEFEKFYRYEKEMKIKVESQNEHMSQIAMPQKYLENFRVVRIIPEPEHRLAIGGNIVYQFGGDDNRQVSFYTIPQSYGSLNGELNVNNQTFSIHHFIFP